LRRAAIEEGGRLTIKIEADGSPEERGEPEEEGARTRPGDVQSLRMPEQIYQAHRSLGSSERHTEEVRAKASLEYL
jgi:hypothetical protein